MSDGTSEAAEIDLDAEIAELSAISRDPRDAKAHRRRGPLKARSRQYDAALRDFERTLRLTPDDVHAYGLRALVWAKKGDRDRAFRDFDQAIKLAPLNAALFEPIAIAYFRKCQRSGRGRRFQHTQEPVRAPRLDLGKEWSLFSRSAISRIGTPVRMSDTICAASLGLTSGNPPTSASILSLGVKSVCCARINRPASSTSSSIASSYASFIAAGFAVSSILESPPLRGPPLL